MKLETLAACILITGGTGARAVSLNFCADRYETAEEELQVTGCRVIGIYRSDGCRPYSCRTASELRECSCDAFSCECCVYHGGKFCARITEMNAGGNVIRIEACEQGIPQ